MLRAAVTPALAVLLTATAAWPCGFHNYAPQPTMVDRLLASDHIVLARSAPDDPFRYQAIEALEGDLASVDLPHHVDSATRRRLASEPQSHVLFAREDADGPWQRLAFVGSEMQPVLDTVMARLPAWEEGEQADRFEIFAALLDSPNAGMRRLALLELDRADYGTLRNLDIRIDVDREVARLDLVLEYDLLPIRILLLGLSGDAALSHGLEDGVSRNAVIGGGALGAYATAWIELAGPEAAAMIAERYLTDRDLPLTSREVLAEALAIHSQVGDPDTRVAVRGAVEAALQTDPSIAPAVARQFGARSDWSQRAALSGVLRNRSVTTLADFLLVSQYVSLADQSAGLAGQ